MTYIRKVLTLFGYQSSDRELARIDRSVNQVKRDSLAASVSVGALGGAFSRAAGFATSLVKTTTALGVAGAGALGWNIAKDLAEADRLFATLETFEGSAEKAEVAFTKLRKVASTTPFAISKVTEAYNQLSAVGLSGSEERLRAWADVAAGLGQDITDTVRAVRGATTGEMEMIKEWGVVSKQAGDQVTFTYKGVSTTMKKTSENIEGYLLNIAKVNFAGGAARQVDTLGGKLVNIKDRMFEFSLATGAGGARGAMMDFLNGILRLQDALSGLAPVIGSLIAKGLGKLTSMMTWLAENPRPVGRFFGTIVFSLKKVNKTLQPIFQGIKKAMPFVAKIGALLAGKKLLGAVTSLGTASSGTAASLGLMGRSMGLLGFAVTDVGAAAMGLPSITGMLFPDMTPEDIQQGLKKAGEEALAFGKGLADGLAGTKLPWDDPEVMKGGIKAGLDATGLFIKDSLKVMGDAIKGPMGDILARGGYGLEGVSAETIGEALAEGIKSLKDTDAWVNALKMPGFTRETGIGEMLGWGEKGEPRATGWAATAELRGVMAKQKEERDRNWERSGWAEERPLGMISDISKANREIWERGQTYQTEQASPQVTNNVNPTINVVINEASDVEAVKAAFEEQVGVTLQEALTATYEDLRPSTAGATS